MALSPVLGSKVKVFSTPFAHQVLNNRVGSFCSNCLRAPENGNKLRKCGACELPWYCSIECQKNAWSSHRNECRRLKTVFPNLPLTEVLFMSKVIDRVLFLAEHGDQFGWQKERTFNSLVDHQEDILKDEAKMAHFEKLHGKMTTFRGSEMVDRQFFFQVFCKTSINSHSIHTNGGIEIGMALDLGVSRYNHCCRPSCSMVFDGIRVFLRPLVPTVDVTDTTKATIAYVDIGRSRYRRRLDLKAKWYFDCFCERCNDTSEDSLTALKCSRDACAGRVATREDAPPTPLSCDECQAELSAAEVEAGQTLMRSLPASFDPQCPISKVEELLGSARERLHSTNVYVTRLQTALFHLAGQLGAALPAIHHSIYDNYKLCFPKADRHVGFSLINIVKSLIEQGKRKKAVWYAYEAMTIFEVCLGLEHPFYLQTLALWTYLEKGMPKTDEELISLTGFGDNRPVDLSAILAKASVLDETPLAITA